MRAVDVCAGAALAAYHCSGHTALQVAVAATLGLVVLVALFAQNRGWL